MKAERFGSTTDWGGFTLLNMQVCDIGSAKIAYTIIGSGANKAIVETALGSCCAEWWHIAEQLGDKYTILLYDRAGYGKSTRSSLARTPKNISQELFKLLTNLKFIDDITLVSHSQGGLYSQQFVRDNPDKVKKLILIDPLSANDNKFKSNLSLKEFKQSGVDKTASFKIGAFLTKFRLGGFFKPLLLKAPPFYFYSGFSDEAKNYILSSLTKNKHYVTALEEYKLSHEESHINHLREKGNFPEIFLVLLTHSSKIAIDEIINFGGMNEEGALKVENIWQEIMQEYLTFTSNSKLIRAEKSSHFIHLTEPDLIEKALLW